jgi:hypothetical protein
MLVDAAEAGIKMILERANRTFCGIAAVHARGNELEVNVLGRDELLERKGTFVFQAMKLGP